jgi:pSer/pThr/pTyr-binding forkhead associated (FHA) protein
MIPPVPLRIELVSTDLQVQLPSIPEVRIGRLDAVNDIVPDLDLTPSAELGDGISRLHCRVHQRGSTYLVEDIGSANGTFLNGERLTPYMPYPLENGDELQLGRFKIKVVGSAMDAEPA